MSLRITTSFALFISIALASIVGSEHGQIKRPRSSISPFIHAVHSFVNDFYRGTNVESRPLLAYDQVDAYIRDGYIVISDLLDTEEMDNLSDAGESIVNKHLEESDGKLPSKNFQVHEFGNVLKEKRFRDIALHSKLPRVAAELMQLNSKTQNLRVLRDVFLAKGHESTSSCGWHVDDQLFWPSSYEMPSASKIDLASTNAWIALDDMPIEYGGSMAVSPQSHAENFSWREEAFAALNIKAEFGNGVSQDDLFDLMKSGKVDSCGLEKFAPHVYDDIELSKQEFNFKKGDVIFMNRFLFHKSTDMTEKGKLALQALQGSSTGAPLLKRFSLRYSEGTSSSLPGGFVTEMSVLASDGLNLGKKLDQVSGSWYPKAWPDVDDDVEDRIEQLVKNDLPVGQEKLGALMAEVMTMFRAK